MSTLALIDRITDANVLEGEIVERAGTQALLPVTPRVAVNVREATLADLPFIDALQKKHSKAVGWMPTMQLEGKIKAKQVLIAESDEATERRSDEGEERLGAQASIPSVASSLRRSVAVPLGYVIGQDRYFKRDDVGIIYQLNVVPSAQRGLIGATLLKAMFERSAYGCRLFCCWCAQDLAANRFWEAMGFVALAFRTGGRGRSSDEATERRSDEGEESAGSHSPSVASSLRRSVASVRTHIFWQKRIRSGDTSTHWWFPAQTSSGSIREDRLVLPIPPGMHWSDAKPTVLPENSDEALQRRSDEGKRRPKATSSPSVAASLRRSVALTPPLSGLRLGAASDGPPKRERREKIREKRKNDPALVAQARELRDRWLEHVAANPAAITSAGKYDVARQIAAEGIAALEASSLDSLGAKLLAA